MERVTKERDFIRQKNIVSVMGYLYDSKGLAPENVCAFLQRMYSTLSENQFSSRLSKEEYISVLYYIAKCGFEANVERQVLETIKSSDESLKELISKRVYLNDFIEVYESAQGFRAENKSLLEEMLQAGVIDTIPCIDEEKRTEYNHHCRKIFNRQMRAVGGNSIFE